MKETYAKNLKTVVACLVLMAFFQGCQNRKPFTLTITHLNDTHGNLEPSEIKVPFNGIDTYAQMGGFPAVTAKVKQLRQSNQNFLFLHAGDVFQGSLYFIKYTGMAEAEFFKLMKPDAMCTGNHEFDKGAVPLVHFIDAVHDIFPVLSANITIQPDSVAAGKIIPYTIKTFGKHKVAIIGITTPETASVSSPGSRITFNDPIASVKPLVESLTRQNINIIVVLAHQGYSNDIKMANAVPGIDIIVGGHTHTLLGQYDDIPSLSTEGLYPTQVQKFPEGPTLIVQSWEKAKLLGILNTTFDKKGKVTHFTGSPVLLLGNKAEDFRQKDATGKKQPVTADTFKAIEAKIAHSSTMEIRTDDTEALLLLSRFSGPVNELKKNVIGTCAEDLYHVREPGEKHKVAGIMKNGSLAAPLVADAFLWKAQSIQPKAPRIVIINGGGVRGDIPKGDLTIGGVYELLPFENALVLFDLTGAQIKEVLKNTMQRSEADPDDNGAFPYTAGLRFTVNIKDTGTDFFSSIEEETETGWVPLEDNKVYHIATLSFIAGGKDGYTLFETVPNKINTGFIDAEIFIDYIKKEHVLKAPQTRGMVNR